MSANTNRHSASPLAIAVTREAVIPHAMQQDVFDFVAA